MKKTNIKVIRKIILSILIVSLILIMGFIIYAMDYMHADEKANSIKELNNITMFDNGDYLLKGTGDIGIIFYPGAKVEEEAYLPLLEKLREQGYNCILVKMPLRFAFLGTNSAEYYINECSEINTWYLAGHSLGGAMASDYASKNGDLVDGLILLGAYIYGDIEPQKTITIYGENDLNLDKSKLGDTNVYMIEGGNHAGFGNYGIQSGDGELKITRDEQQDITVNLIKNFIEEGADK